MRSLIVNRKKQFAASLVAATIIIDGNEVGKLKNGMSVTLELDENEHEVAVKLGQLSDVVKISAGSEDVTLNGMFSRDRFVIASSIGAVNSIDNGVMVSEDGAVSEAVAVEPKSLVPSVICAVVLVLIVTLVAQLILSSGETSVTGAWVGIGISVLAAICMVLGGFWFYIIPLPYVFVYKFGCNRGHLKLGTRVILGILSLVLFGLAFLAMFLIR